MCRRAPRRRSRCRLREQEDPRELALLRDGVDIFGRAMDHVGQRVARGAHAPDVVRAVELIDDVVDEQGKLEPRIAFRHDERPPLPEEAPSLELRLPPPPGDAVRPVHRERALHPEAVHIVERDPVQVRLDRGREGPRGGPVSREIGAQCGVRNVDVLEHALKFRERDPVRSGWGEGARSDRSHCARAGRAGLRDVVTSNTCCHRVLPGERPLRRWLAIEPGARPADRSRP
jgi:hypothetical protein